MGGVYTHITAQCKVTLDSSQRQITHTKTQGWTRGVSLHITLSQWPTDNLGSSQSLHLAYLKILSSPPSPSVRLASETVELTGNAWLDCGIGCDLSPRTMPQEYLTWWLLAVPSPPDCAAAPGSTILPYYYSTMLVIYEHLHILTMFCYNLPPAQPEEDWPPHLAWFLSRFLPSFWPF